MGKEITLTIFGEPTGKKRPITTSKNGFVKTYTPKETTHYESKVVYEYKQRYENIAFEPHRQLKAVIIAYYGIPKKYYKFYKKTNSVELDKQGQLMLRGFIRPTKKPDTDNIAKICLDSLNGIAYYDDSQIVELVVEKWYEKEPRVEIAIWELNNEDYWVQKILSWKRR